MFADDIIALLKLEPEVERLAVVYIRIVFLQFTIRNVNFYKLNDGNKFE